jgi:hypothetical protein
MERLFIHGKVRIVAPDIFKDIVDSRLSVYGHLNTAGICMHALHAEKFYRHFHIVIRHIHIGTINIIPEARLQAHLAQKTVCLFVQEAELFYGLALRDTIGCIPFLFVDDIAKLPVVLHPFLHEQFM